MSKTDRSRVIRCSAEVEYAIGIVSVDQIEKAIEEAGYHAQKM